MSDLPNIKKEKSKTFRFRMNQTLEKEVADWLKLHPAYDFSKMVRSAVEAKIHKDSPIESEEDKIVTRIDKLGDELGQKMIKVLEKFISASSKGKKLNVKQLQADLGKHLSSD